jgi:hypothetical protein
MRAYLPNWKKKLLITTKNVCAKLDIICNNQIHYHNNPKNFRAIKDQPFQ